jgi:hypothetical protein
MAYATAFYRAGTLVALSSPLQILERSGSEDAFVPSIAAIEPIGEFFPAR